MTRKAVEQTQKFKGLEEPAAVPLLDTPAFERIALADLGRSLGVVIPDGMELRPAVRQLLDARATNPHGLIYWKGLTQIEDWVQFFAIHPSWQGRSVLQVRLDRVNNGGSFIAALGKWIRQEAGHDAKSRLALIRRIFPDYTPQRDWSDYRSIGDWKTEFLRHPNWQGKSMYNLLSQYADGTAAFVQAFKNWVQREVGTDRIRRQELIRELFPDYIAPEKQRDWSTFTTAEMWREQYLRHPELYNYSIGQLLSRSAQEGKAFIEAFRRWAKKESKGDSDKYTSIIRVLFPNYDRTPNNADWSEFKTISTWKEHYQAHPDWHGKSIGQLLQDRDGGGASFYTGFRSWVTKQAGRDRERRTELIREIFPEYQSKRDWLEFTTVEQWRENLIKHPEWSERTMDQLSKDDLGGSLAFVAAFQRWAAKEAKGDLFLKRAILSAVFPYHLRQRCERWFVDDPQGLEIKSQTAFKIELQLPRQVLTAYKIHARDDNRTLVVWSVPETDAQMVGKYLKEWIRKGGPARMRSTNTTTILQGLEN